MILESRREEDIKDDTTVEGDNSEGKIKNNFTMSKLNERCHNIDILKDTKLLDAISSVLED